MPLPIISLRDNPNFDVQGSHQPYYYASIDLAPVGVDYCVTHLPIYVRHESQPNRPSTAIYSTLVAGIAIEHHDLTKLAQMIVGNLQTLIGNRQLPCYIFQIGQKAWPIYNVGSDLLAVSSIGQAFRAATIGEMRMQLTDYFMRMRKITSRKDLRILYLSRTTLQLSAPACMMRTGAGPDVPVFATRSDTGTWLLAPIHGETIQAQMSRGLGLFQLYTSTADKLMKQGKLDYRFRMTIRKLSPSHWGHIAERLKPEGHLLTYIRVDLPEKCRHVLDVYSVTRQMLVAPYQNRAGAITLYMGPDLEVLRRRLGQELTVTGRLENSNAITIVE